jgi:hypothetical protein
MSVQRTIVGTLAVPLLLAALTSCGGGDDSVADPPVSSAPTSSPTESPQRESPEHFVRRWAREDVRMQNTGATSAFRSLTNHCGGCAAVADRVDAIYKAGGHVETEGWTLRHIGETDRRGQKRTIEITVDSAPTTYVEAKGDDPKHLNGGRERFQVQIEPSGNSWVVTAFVQVGA